MKSIVEEYQQFVEKLPNVKMTPEARKLIEIAFWSGYTASLWAVGQAYEKQDKQRLTHLIMEIKAWQVEHDAERTKR